MLIRTLAMISMLFLIGGLFMLCTMIHRRHKLIDCRAEWQKYGAYFIIVQSIVLLAFSGYRFVAVFVVGIAVLATIEFIQRLIQRHSKIIWSTILFGVLISAGFGHIFIWERQNISGPFAFVLIISASSDSFAQLWGRSFGKHKLCPGLSPNKTVEGLIGGFLSTPVVAFLFRFLIPGFDIWQILTISTLLTAAAVAGDLIFSLIKRKLRIKDFSNLLPGHGGIMDRFDSLVLALPVFYWSVRFLKI